MYQKLDMFCEFVMFVEEHEAVEKRRVRACTLIFGFINVRMGKRLHCL